MRFQKLVLAVVFSFGAPGTALALGGDEGHASHAHGAQAGSAVTLTGEVMDLVCYMQHAANGQGPAHANCAKQCILKGLPMGLKVGGQLYLLMGKGHDSVSDQVAPFAGKQAAVTGTVVERDGMKALIMDTIQPGG